MGVSRVRALILLLISLGLPECPAFGQNPPDQAQKIAVAAVKSKDVTIAQQYVCKLHARRHIEVRAPAEGYIAAIPVGEGRAVKAGESMLEILPIRYQAMLAAKQAERDFAQLELSHVQKLAEKQGVSQLEANLYKAKLAKAQAEAELARVDLNFTTVKAPFDGLTGRLLRQEGSFVLKGDVLTTLSDTSVMGAYFQIPERHYLEYMAEKVQSQQSPEIELILAGRSKFPQAGKIGAILATFNNETGDISFRADFPNPDGLLRHGQTGTLSINRVLKDAIVIPQRATFEILDKRYVYVVDKDHVAHQREIAVQNETEDLFVAKKGVAVGDRIVTDGVRMVRDGEKVE
jgi:membrane fusion protein (multidrug efflux system)